MKKQKEGKAEYSKSMTPKEKQEEIAEGDMAALLGGKQSGLPAARKARGLALRKKLYGGKGR